MTVVDAEAVAVAPAPSADAAAAGTRGRRQTALLRIGGELDVAWRIGLSALGVVVVILAWTAMAARVCSGGAVVPTPIATMLLSGSWPMRTARSIWSSMRSTLRSLRRSRTSTS